MLYLILLHKVKAHVKVRRGNLSNGTSGSDLWIAEIFDPELGGTSGTVAVGDGYLEGEYLNVDNDTTKNYKVTRQSLNIIAP